MIRALALALSLLPGLAAAQMTASLVADSMAVSADGMLVASGNVEAFYDGARLSAAAVVYDRDADLLRIEGPIFITTADGTILTATQAELDPRFENGILRGARLVLDRQLQLAAHRIDRADGRFSQLTRVAATSCAICGDRPPLWSIRADRVVHDAAAQQLYFENAVFAIRDVPVFWIPAMRLPDPTLERATGLMIPELRTSDTLGVGLALPYFIALGDSRDLRITPYVSAETRTFEARFRQAFANGEMQVDAALSRDTLREGLRGFASATGSFDLGPGRDLSFDLMTVSDPSYLLDYGLSDRDRIDSTLRFAQVRADSLLTADLTVWQSLRENETVESLPPLIAGVAWERRHALGGGTLTWGAEALSFARIAAGDGDAARDVTRAGAFADWRQRLVFGPGLVLDAEAALTLQARAVTDDSAYGDSLFTALPAAGVALRWPLVRHGAGATQVLEPAVALSWADAFGDAVPAEDAALSEFDTGNLFALTRVAGQDARESGASLAAGVTWTRIGAQGAVQSLTFGRVLHDRDAGIFTASSGLAGTTSDWLLAGSLSLPAGFALQARTLFDSDLAFGKTEARLDWRSARFGIGAAYVWLPADAAEDRDRAVSEWTLAGDWTISETWAIRAEGRYDVANDTPARAGFGVAWSNECVTVDLSLSRRYTETETADPSTSLGLAVTLNGFSAGRATGPAAQCRDRD